jgi:hypothetical protein
MSTCQISDTVATACVSLILVLVACAPVKQFGRGVTTLIGVMFINSLLIYIFLEYVVSTTNIDWIQGILIPVSVALLTLMQCIRSELLLALIVMGVVYEIGLQRISWIAASGASAALLAIVALVFVVIAKNEWLSRCFQFVILATAIALLLTVYISGLIQGTTNNILLCDANAPSVVTQLSVRVSVVAAIAAVLVIRSLIAVTCRTRNTPGCCVRYARLCSWICGSQLDQDHLRTGSVQFVKLDQQKKKKKKKKKKQETNNNNNNIGEEDVVLEECDLQ